MEETLTHSTMILVWNCKKDRRWLHCVGFKCRTSKEAFTAIRAMNWYAPVKLQMKLEAELPGQSSSHLIGMQIRRLIIPASLCAAAVAAWPTLDPRFIWPPFGRKQEYGGLFPRLALGQGPFSPALGWW